MVFWSLGSLCYFPKMGLWNFFKRAYVALAVVNFTLYIGLEVTYQVLKVCDVATDLALIA